MRTFRLPGIRAPSPFPTHGFRQPAASDSRRLRPRRGFPTAAAAAVPRRTRPNAGLPSFDRPRLPNGPRRQSRVERGAAVPPRDCHRCRHTRAPQGGVPHAGLPSLSAYRAPEASGTVRSAASWRVCRGSPHAGARAVVFLPRPAAARGGRPWKTVAARPVFFRPRRAANVICTRFYGDHAAGGSRRAAPRAARAFVTPEGRCHARPCRDSGPGRQGQTSRRPP